MDSKVALITAVVLTAGIFGFFMLGGYAPFVTDFGTEPRDDAQDTQDGGDPEDREGPTGDGVDDGDEEVQPFPEFERMSDEMGISYSPVRTDEYDLMSGGGVFVADINNNGYEDVLLTGEAYPKLYENTGDGYVEKQTFFEDRVRVAHFVDYNNNGYRDLVLAQFNGELILYENTGGEFERTDESFGVETAIPTSITSADFTNNGCADLVVGQFGYWTQEDPLGPGGREQVVENHPDHRPDSQTGQPNFFFEGDCNGFTDRSEETGMTETDWTIAVSAADFTGNGLPDIHFGNDFTADWVYENRGDGEFVKQDLGPDSDRNAMASVAFDMTETHLLDLFVTNVYQPQDSVLQDGHLTPGVPVPDGNNLFVNDGTGEFEDRAADHTLEKGGWGWAASISDFSNNGYPDVLHGVSCCPPYEELDPMYETMQVWQGQENQWEKIAGQDVGFTERDHKGIARVDATGTGDLDIVAGAGTFSPEYEQRGGTSDVYVNQGTASDSVQFFVRDPNALDLNAEVIIETTDRDLYRVSDARGDFKSQDSRLIHVATKQDEEIEQVRVIWPDGEETTYTDVDLGNRYVLTPDGPEHVFEHDTDE